MYMSKLFSMRQFHAIVIFRLKSSVKLSLVSGSGLLDGLQNFCTKNLTAVNEIKSKCMTFGKAETINVTFNNKNIAQVAKYKFLGNIIKSARRLKQNILAENQQYLSKQANRANGAMYHRLRSVGTLPPHIVLHMFNGLIKPIIVYDSEVWGYDKTAQGETYKVFSQICQANIVSKTYNKQYHDLWWMWHNAPSVQCIISALCFWKEYVACLNTLFLNKRLMNC